MELKLTSFSLTPAVRLTPNTICMFVFLEQLRHVVDIVRDTAPLAAEPVALK
jgi:hypothetical protein